MSGDSTTSSRPRFCAVYVQYTRAPCGPTDQMRRDGQTAASSTDRPSKRPTRSALHHRLRRRQTDAATDRLGNHLLVQHKVCRKTKRRTPPNATRRNKTVAMFRAKTVAIQSFFSSFVGMHSLRSRRFVRNIVLPFPFIKCHYVMFCSLNIKIFVYHSKKLHRLLNG